MKRVLLGALLGALVASPATLAAQQIWQPPQTVTLVTSGNLLMRADDPSNGVSCYYFTNLSRTTLDTLSPTCLKP